MPELDVFSLFVRPLHAAGVKYFIAGSFGSMFYSEPRLTLDIDLPVVLSNQQLMEMPKWFPAPEYYCPPPEVLALENKRECRAHFNIIHIGSGFKADVYPAQYDAFFAWAFDHRRIVEINGGEVFYAPPEYIIVWKVAYFAEGGGEKHVRDIRRMLELSGAEVDHAVLDRELARRGLMDAYRTITSG